VTSDDGEAKGEAQGSNEGEADPAAADPVQLPVLQP